MVRWQKPLLPMPVDPPRLVELLAHGLGAQFLVCVCFVASGCEHAKEEPGKHDEQQVTAPTVERPAELYLPSDEPRQHALDVRKDEGDPVDGFSFGPAPSGTVPPLLARGVCPADMVAVGNELCIDRFEVFLVDAKSGRELSPHYPPDKQRTTMLFERWDRRASTSGRAMGRLIPVPMPPLFQLNDDFAPRARSVQGALPAGYLNRGHAEAACNNAGKRLCSRGEWVRACRGDQGTKFPYGDKYQAGVCNVHRASHPATLLHGDASQHHLDPRLGLSYDDDGPLLRPSGSFPECASRWGNDKIYDMVGNLDEWIEDAEGAFVGGFFSRATKEGCDSSIDSHSPGYLDYSLGARCCQNQ